MYITGNFRLQERTIIPTSTCPNTTTTNTYTAQDSLSFGLLCGQNLISDSIGSAPHSNVQACIDQCAVYRPRCYGVSYDTNTGSCEFKNQSDVFLADLNTDVNFNSAIANATQLKSPTNTTCPFPSNSNQYTKEGMEFEILCNLDMPYGEYHPSNVNYAPYHANTLQDCMEFCAISRPLCVGVSWNPDMEAGFANCYPKNSQDGTPTPPKNNVVHSALWKNNQLNVSCPANTTYLDSNYGKSFETSCNSGRLGGTNTSYHDANLDGCIDTCASNSSNNCLGVVYDGSLQGGFLNCYLLNATGEPTSIANSTFALFTPSNKSATAPSPHRGSRAFIAGPVIGGIAVIALLVGFLLWRRRKRSTKAEGSVPAYESTDYKKVAQPNYQVGHPLHELHDSHNNTPKMATDLKSPPRHELYDQGTNTPELATDLKSPPRQELYDRRTNAHELG